MSEQHVEITVTPVADRLVTDLTPVTMIEAQFTTSGAKSWKRWYLCTICGREFREDQIALINGAPYCLRYKHDVEAQMKGT